MTKPKREIYLLEGLSPEVRAVTFAKTSRSPKSFRDIAAELTEEKSAEFHEKWVVGYGHASVAEHAFLSIALENVSSLACKYIEDNRLSSFTEKSSRYQTFNKTQYYTPKDIAESKYAKEYQEALDNLFDTYEEFYPIMEEFIQKKYPQTEKQSAGLYKSVTKARICDNIRYLLPQAVYRNLGWTINARNLELAIVKFLSNPLTEVREIGQDIKKAAISELPTLIKFADQNEYIFKTNEKLGELSKKYDQRFGQPEMKENINIVNYDKDGEDRLVAALLYKFSRHNFEKILAEVKKMSSAEKEKIIEESLIRRGKFDQPFRELEHLYYNVDFLMEYSAWYDLQRHRMCTQTHQLQSFDYGYATPEEIKEADLEKQYLEAQEKAKDLFNKVVKIFPWEAQYICTFAVYTRVFYTMNLRELHHFISLRSGPKGHIAYRRVAQNLWKKLNEIQPMLAKFIRVNMENESESWAATLDNKAYDMNPFAARERLKQNKG
ncbi:FAD-dependent thymidylate synthase [Patescibacteria group bacterium]|nr:FAD-dependent thymidylate synthase [Patescibacteria group bacterium]